MDLNKQIKELEERLDVEGESGALLFELGRLYWKAGDKSKAISLYNHSAELEPDGPASIALEQARNIMDFYNHDLLNP